MFQRAEGRSVLLVYTAIGSTWESLPAVLPPLYPYLPQPLPKHSTAALTPFSSTQPPIPALAEKYQPKPHFRKNGWFLTATRIFQRAGSRAVFLVCTVIGQTPCTV